MLIFVVVIFLTILFIALHFVIDAINKKDSFYNSDCLFLVLGGCMGIFLITMLAVVFREYVQAPSIEAEKQETYKSLVYKAETESIRDDFGILNKEYIDEVQTWNEDIAYNQALTHNIWIGVFIPNFYDNLECIDLETIQMRE